MFSLTGFKVGFTPSWRMSLLAFLFISLFARLGFWQLHRAHEKTNMLTSQQRYAKQAPTLWQPGNALPAQYEQMKIQGHFLTTVFLLDNQHYQHQFGYDVISPVLLTNNQVVLVDRGWVVGELTRQELPVIETPSGLVNLTGSAYYPSSKNWLLGDVVEKMQPDLAVVELIDIHLISQFLHKSVYPFIIRLGKHETNGYVREWAVIAMTPQRHYAYALQWFAMASVILLLFIVLNIKKKT